MLGKAQLSYKELLTVLIEVEGVFNSRPLTYIYPEVTEESLTPSHLVIGRRLTLFLIGQSLATMKIAPPNYNERRDTSANS